MTTSGALSGYIATGTEKGALGGALSAGLFYGVGEIGEAYGMADGSLGKIALHAAVGCISASASGGACKQGAYSAGFFEAALPYTSRFGVIGSAVAGGTASVIGGG
ncbi:MAG TPA: DUF637 domain-containing protein, partial [Thiobacillus sp.]